MIWSLVLGEDLDLDPAAIWRDRFDQLAEGFDGAAAPSDELADVSGRGGPRR